MKIPKVKATDLITITDFTRDEIIDIFKFAVKLKSYLALGKKHRYLEGRTLAMIFEKHSTRTRVSFESGMFQLGGHALSLVSDDIQLGRGETTKDTAKVLSRYVDAIMIRTSSHDKLKELADNANVPVINGLTNTSHPCQALSDFFSIYEREKDFKKVKLSYIGDGNNVANSLLLGAAILGIDISIACPNKYMPDNHIVEDALRVSHRSGSSIDITPDIDRALRNANFLYTDVWVSMGQEMEIKKKKKALNRYKISKETLKICADNCLVMHCLPAKRGEEIDDNIIDSDRSIVFDQAENRLHVQKSILCSLIRRG